MRHFINFNSSPNIIGMVKLRRMRPASKEECLHNLGKKISSLRSRWDENIQVWLRHYATGCKDMGSIPNEVTGFFN
jgi:hypothetical protein